MTTMYVASIVGLLGFVLLWLVFLEIVRAVLAMSPNEKLIVWGIGPYGITTLTEQNPSRTTVVISGILPALVSGSILYIGFFTQVLNSFHIVRNPAIEISMILLGVFISCGKDLITMLQDLRVPLWGELRILRALQRMQSEHYSLHFTGFGLDYIQKHFGVASYELLQTLG